MLLIRLSVLVSTIMGFKLSWGVCYPQMKFFWHFSCIKQTVGYKKIKKIVSTIVLHWWHKNKNKHDLIIKYLTIKVMCAMHMLCKTGTVFIRVKYKTFIFDHICVCTLWYTCVVFIRHNFHLYWIKY